MLNIYIEDGSRDETQLRCAVDAGASKISSRVKVPGFDLFGKISLALFAALSLAYCVLFIKPSDVDPRFGLTARAFFGTVANIYLANSMVPDSGGFGLIDFVTGIGLVTIFIIVAESVMSLAIHGKLDDPEWSCALDRVTAAILIPCYIITNIVVARAAYMF